MSRDDRFENLTDVELARDIYLGIGRNDDALPDSVMDLFDEPLRKAAALWDRLRGPYCEAEGCNEPHIEHFPWCHLPGHHEAVLAQREPDRAT